MSARVRLLFGVHAHQPVGNFSHVIKDAVHRCYRPFLQALERHPGIRFSLHVSGWLLGQLNDGFREDVERIARMVKRGQVELIGGGDTEPVLAAIPEHDRRDQLRAMTARIADLFGVEPSGAWLTERVWESTVVPALHDCGLRFVAVDDYHFLSVGVTSELTGYFSTEENGKRLDLFPISEGLRYAIPFTPAADVVAEIECFPDGAAAIHFDDIEKFGVWPDTYEWVYERGWLEEMLTRLEASSRVETQTFGDYHRANPSRGLVYLPTASYAEMNEWTLPAAGARHLRTLIERSREAGTLREDLPMMRGGIWKSFLLKYQEANWMHKRVEQASRRLHALPRERQSTEMRAALHRAQANDAYWHGLFGGFYLPFLRRSVFANLARLESRLDELGSRPPSQRADIDLDGRDEVALRGGRFYAVIRPSEGGRLCELTDYPFAHNFADVVARRDEEYYDVIRSGRRPPPLHPPRPGIASIHDRIEFTTPIAPGDLEPDRAPRGLFVDAWSENPGGAGIVLDYECSPESGEAAATCRAQPDGVTIEKTLRIEGDALRVRYAILASRTIGGALNVELSIAMPSANGSGGSFEVDGERAGDFGSVFSRSDAHALSLDDAELGGSLSLEVTQPCELTVQPLMTVSRSELGFEKIMQATVVKLTWTVSLAAGERGERTITLRAR